MMMVSFLRKFPCNGYEWINFEGSLSPFFTVKSTPIIHFLFERDLWIFYLLYARHNVTLFTHIECCRLENQPLTTKCGRGYRKCFSLSLFPENFPFSHPFVTKRTVFQHIFQQVFHSFFI